MPKYVKKLSDGQNLFKSPQSSTKCALHKIKTLCNERMQATATAENRYGFSRTKYSLFPVKMQYISL